jgi:transmembrane sensor
MSAAGPEDTAPGDGVQDIEARASAWLRRRHLEDWGAEDEGALAAWLGQSMNHAVAYWRIKAVWDRTERLAALRPGAPKASFGERRRWLWPIIAKAAGVAAAIVILGIGALWAIHGPRERVYATAVGEREIITLADGSQIELNTDTVLRADVSAGKRRIWLEKGEAYFQVKHDAAHPFVVTAGRHRVTDLGTKFLIRDDRNHFEVAVMDGRVRLDSTARNGHTRSALLTPGDVALATENAVSIRHKPKPVLADELSWRRGMLVFRRTTLADAAAEFNRYNDEKIVVADPKLAKLQIGGTFQANNINAFIEVTQDVLGLHAVRRAGAIVISR